MSFFNKGLSKAIMTRTKLRNIFLQNRSEENRIRYLKQRIFLCLSFKKNKKLILWKCKCKVCCRQLAILENSKTSLSDKFADKDKIHLIENNELAKTDPETAEILNNVFFTI